MQLNVGDLFRIAQLHYESLRTSETFISEPNYLRFQLASSHPAAHTFAVVSNGRFKEIEIQDDTGEIETIQTFFESVTYL